MFSISCSQLQRSGHSPSRRNSLGSDELIDDIDGNFEVLNDKVNAWIQLLLLLLLLLFSVFVKKNIKY